ncbi:hypothetical protein B0I35DRAFT_450033 [Stachybotrys elegans]|uniref:Aminoglycoside phosphotransferase domain-containing protein n=1 Tax=Stachybotrys elegans TaxID=80388 RepID=A0A8K0SVK4_9HYPO|nr:hypothetical protein B0I35DRAFT_450033 [Stachybotrys elegans]
MSPLWPCDWEGCQSPAVQRAGDCLLCNKHLCRLHLEEQWHKCPKPESNWNDYSKKYLAEEARRLDELYRKIDGAQLCIRASQVRSDAKVPWGGQNCHAEIVFEDGVVWLVRFRLSSPISPPPEVRDYVLQSEAATMQFLEHHTNIPSPKVFDWACESDSSNTTGVGYILMESMPGMPLDWQGATMSQKQKIVRQFADIILEIERHPFDKLGSLVTTAAPKTSIGPQRRVDALAQHSTFRSGKDGRPLGPFQSSREELSCLVEAHLQMIAAGEIGTTENAIDVFLAHRFRLDLLDQAFKQSASANTEGERFFLKHADDKGDHILVNADFEIVGIIDWEWCSTASREVAFSSPCMMWPVAAFYDGSNELAKEEVFLAHVFREKGREDLARYVLDGRKVQRLLFALGPGGAVHEDKRTFASLFMGLKRAFHGLDAELGDQDVEAEWEAWKKQALVDWKHETLLKAMLKGT